MDSTAPHFLLFSLFFIFLAAKIFAEIFERLHQPAVVGEILAGVLIGPSVLGWIHPSEITHALSEIGVILLLFTVGLEIKPHALMKVGGRALGVAVLGVVFPFFAGWAFMHFWGAPTIEGVFIGAAMVATSVGITARVLAGMNRLSTEAAQIILAAAVIDDILGLLILSGVSSLANQSVHYIELLLTAFVAVAFTLFMIFLAPRLIQKTKPALERLKMGHSYFVLALILCFGFSYLASLAGVAAIIGAFFAGMAFSELAEEQEIHSYATGVTEFFVPFFLVGIGLQLDIAVFSQASVIGLALLVTVLAVVTKLLGCGLAAWPLGLKNASRIGMGMVPRGEVGIIVAQIGLSLGSLDASLYAVVVFMAVATTLIAPPFLKILFKEVPPNSQKGIVNPEEMLSEIQ